MGFDIGHDVHNATKSQGVEVILDERTKHVA